MRSKVVVLDTKGIENWISRMCWVVNEYITARARTCASTEDIATEHTYRSTYNTFVRLVSSNRRQWQLFHLDCTCTCRSTSAQYRCAKVSSNDKLVKSKRMFCRNSQSIVILEDRSRTDWIES